MNDATAWKRAADGLDIAVRVTPRSNREAFSPGTPAYFTARLMAPPVDGAANEALIALVARRFGLPRRAVTLIAGDSARLKRLHLIGDPEALAKIATTLYDEAP